MDRVILQDLEYFFTERRKAIIESESRPDYSLQKSMNKKRYQKARDIVDNSHYSDNTKKYLNHRIDFSSTFGL